MEIYDYCNLSEQKLILIYKKIILEFSIINHHKPISNF